MKNVIKLCLFLACVAMLAALAVGSVYEMTEPVIQENLIKAEKANLELMYPGSEFKAVTYSDDSGLVLGVYEVVGKGYVFKLQGHGYSPNGFVFLAGFDKEGNFDNLIPLTSSETSGIGTRAFEASYLDTLKSGKFDTLSGATRTSGGIIRGLEAAKAILEGLK